MGADVGLGQVVGNNVRCPYHHWEYNGQGSCVRIPSGDKIPKDTSLFSFPCEETQGLIWVFLGKEPTYPVPVVPNCEEGKVLSRSFELVLKEPMLVERSEEHTSELQSLMRISYAVFCLKKNRLNNNKA